MRKLIAEIKRFVRRAVVTVLTVAFLVVATFGALTVWFEVDELTDACDTRICCPDCETIPVTRVIDGDTLRSNGGRVRLYGMDTPERGQRCFDEATDRLIELAQDSVRVEAGPRSHDQYDRRLFYTYRPGRGHQDVRGRRPDFRSRRDQSHVGGLQGRPQGVPSAIGHTGRALGPAAGPARRSEER